MEKDCYFWIDPNVPEEERIFNIYCSQCRAKNPKVDCWFWEGSIKGFGPYDYVCDSCGYVVHKNENQNEDARSV